MKSYANTLSIILLFILIKLPSGSIIDAEMVTPTIMLFRDIDRQCSAYCIEVVKPILIQTKLIQNTALQNKVGDLYATINNTETELKVVKIKLRACEEAAQNSEALQIKINEKDAGLKQLEGELSSLQDKIGTCEEALKHKQIQNDQLLDLSASYGNSSNIINELIASNRALLEKHQSTAQADTVKLELNEKQFKDMESMLREKDEKIMQDTAKIKELQDIISSNELQLSKYQSSSCIGKSTDVHIINVPGIDPFPVFCDSVLADSGWTVIQRRRDGSVSFHRNWTDYRLGFGDLRGEFFLGLEKIHLITTSQNHELYIFLHDFDGNHRFARYDNFLIGNEREFYKLKSLGNYKGTAGDALTSQKDMKFSTPDRDNDVSPVNCAHEFRAGWWYRKCYFCNLNGQYFNKRTKNQYGVNWFAWRTNSLQFVQMMIRPTK